MRSAVFSLHLHSSGLRFSSTHVWEMFGPEVSRSQSIGEQSFYMRNLISIHVHLSQVSSIKHLHLESELLVLFWFLPRMNDYQGHNHGPQRMQPNNWPWSQGMVHSWRSGCHCCPADPRRLPGGNQGVPRHMGPIGHPPQGPIGHAPMALTQAWHGSDLLKKIYDILPMKLGTR